MKQTISHNLPAASPLRRIFKRTRRLLCAAGILATITVPAMATAPLWVPQSGTGARYDSNIHFTDANTGWFTAGSKVRKTTDGGNNWVELNPSANDGLTGIHFVDGNTGWASGFDGAITKTTNGGASWIPQTDPTGSHCWSVFALNSNSAWMAGSTGMLGRTTDGGATWIGSQDIPLGNPGWGQYDVYFTDANTGYSVAGGDWSSKTVNGGVTWTQMTTGTTEQLLKVNFANANTGWAVGVNGTIIKTTDAGATWNSQTSGTTETLTGVSFVSANTGWVVGYNGTILHTVNGGTTWTPQASGVTELLGDVHFVDATHGWIVGHNNTVLKYNPGPVVTTVIDDKFDDGSIATNTLGIGNGFLNYSQAGPISESGGFANLNNSGGYATHVIRSNPANAVNPFQATPTTMTYKFGTVGNDAPWERLWLGWQPTGTTNDHLFAGGAHKAQGIYISLQANQVEDGYPQRGNLVVTSNTGVHTVLASWDWSDYTALSGLQVSLTTTNSTYALTFSGATATPSFITGAASGAITGLGPVGGNFDTGIHNQYVSGPGGVLLDRVTVTTGGASNAAPTNIALSANSIPENNTAAATIGTLSATDANSGDTHTFSLVSGTGSTDNGAFTITGNVLSINASADFETQSSYAIRIRATDSGAGNLTFEKEFTVSITDVTIPQVIDFGALAGKTFGDADFAVSATGGASGQPVTFSIASGPASIVGDTVSITGAGDVTVRASQAGFGDYSAASNVDQSFTVAKAAQLVSLTNPGARTFGASPFALNATGGLSGNSIVFSVQSGPASVAGNILTITGAGDVTIDANQAGNANYFAGSDSQVFTVSKAAQLITFAPPANASTFGTITLSATGGASGNAVVFSVFSGPGSLAGDVLSFSGPGLVVVRASQSGNANYLAASPVNASITVIANALPIAVDDAATSTVGTTTLYPLANDTDADSPNLSISAVSNPAVEIDGRALVVPAGFAGTFSYTVTDGVSSDIGDVTILAGTPVAAPTVWSGLLYDSAGAIAGRARVSTSVGGINVLTATVGSTVGTAVFAFPASNTISGISTELGALSITKTPSGRMEMTIGTATGNLRPSKTAPSAGRFNVGFAAVDPSIPGGSYAKISILPSGRASLSMRLPDGKAFVASAEYADNDTMSFFGREILPNRSPHAYVGGELVYADLALTDITGEFEWRKPAQPAGLHRTGLSTVLVANGSAYNGVHGFPDGPAVVTLSGAGFVTPVSIATTSSAGAVASVLPRLISWTTRPTNLFVARVSEPSARKTSAVGIFLPKSRTAVGYFPGVTKGGRIEMRVP